MSLNNWLNNYTPHNKTSTHSHRGVLVFLSLPITGRNILPLLLMLGVGLVGCRKITPDWATSATFTGKKINAITFVNDTLGFAVGGIQYKEDLILRTSDGGKTWKEFPQEVVTKSVFDLEFLPNSPMGIGCGIDGKILFTRDYGLTWELNQPYYWISLEALDVFNDTLCVAVGGNGYTYGIVERNRKVENFWEWEKIDTFPFILHDVAFVTPQMGFICGYGAILKTIDSGYHWEYTEAEGDNFIAMAFPSENIGYAIGRGGSILKTIDSGKTWDCLRNGNSLALPKIRWNALHFLNDQVGYLAGDKGILWKTEDGGKKWKAFEKFNKERLLCIAILSNGKGFVGTEKGNIYEFTE